MDDPSLMTPEEYARIVVPLEARRDETMVPNIIACITICSVASAVIIGLRAASRIYSGVRFARHDHLIFVSWFFLLNQCCTLGAMTRFGAGRHFIVVESSADVKRIQVLNLCNEISYFLCLGFIKLSITNLYTAIFPQKKFRWACWALNAITIGWMISGTLVTVFMCNPPQRTWDPFNTEGTCINYRTLLVVAGALNIASDVMLLLIPVPLVLRLNLSTNKKNLILLSFFIGGIACIASAVRMYFVVSLRETYDGTWESVWLLEVSSAELVISLLCACLPTYRPLYRRLFRSSANRSASSKPEYGSAMYRNDITADARSVRIMSTPGDENQHLEGINVTKDIDMITFSRIHSTWVQVQDDDETRLTGHGQGLSSVDTRSFETLPER